jgi:hypothetical protein
MGWSKELAEVMLVGVRGVWMREECMLICHCILFMGRGFLRVQMMMAENKTSLSLSLESFLDPVPYLDYPTVTKCFGLDSDWPTSFRSAYRKRRS